MQYYIYLSLKKSLSDSSVEGGSPRGSDCDPRETGVNQDLSIGTRQLNPFGMDLGYKSNRSSIVSQDQVSSNGILYILVSKYKNYKNNLAFSSIFLQIGEIALM